MCGAEPLVSMNSAESVDAFYKPLGKRKHLSASRPPNVSPRWPAARNDHYCDQNVCRHAVLDLSPLCIPTDSDSDLQTPGGDTSNTRYGTCSPIRSRLADENAGEDVQSNHGVWDVGQDTPPSSHDSQGLRSSQISPKNPDSSARALRLELDNLHISSAESYIELEERFVGLSNSYHILSLGYDRLAEKHDSLLHTTGKLGAQLGVQAEALMALNDWKMRTQKSFAEVQVQGKDPELLYYGTPHSTSTVDIATEKMEPYHLAAEIQDSRTIADRRDAGVAGLETPPMTPGSPLEKHVVRPHLVLRLPPRPDDEEGLVKPTSGLVSDQHASSKRTRKPTEKRKAAELQAESTGKKAKKSRK